MRLFVYMRVFLSPSLSQRGCFNLGVPFFSFVLLITLSFFQVIRLTHTALFVHLFYTVLNLAFDAWIKQIAHKSKRRTRLAT